MEQGPADTAPGAEPGTLGAAGALVAVGTAGPADRLVRAVERVLGEAGVDSPRADAELLVAFAAEVTRGDLQHAALLGCPVLSGPEQLERLRGLVNARAARVPLQHLTGTAPFRHLELAVGPGVFVPRPETEVVAQVAVDEARRVVAERGSAVVVDLCTGSGAVALAIAQEVPGAQVHAVELDAQAHAWAQRNVDALGVGVTLVRGDARTALTGLDGRCDVVVSNPPYVPTGAVPRDREVAEHDPAVALYGLGPDGLEVPRGVTRAAARLLAPGGLYVMEHAEVQDLGARQMVDVTEQFEPARTLPDLTGRPRMVVARRRGPSVVEDSSS